MRAKCILVGLALVVLLSGCSAIGMFPNKTITNVNLERKNYRMVKPNAIGKSTGVSLFGIIPLSAPRYTNAMSDLYSNVDMSMGGAYALAHVVRERSDAYIILFSFPTLTVRADIIEFIDENK